MTKPRRKTRKSQPGCCGVCGCPVAQPSAAQRLCAIGEATYGAWDKPVNEGGWASGHEFDAAGKLVRVRCKRHGGHGFA